MKIFNKKYTSVFAIVALASSSLLSSCMKKDDFVEVLGDASVKVVNTIPGSDAQNLFQNDKKITTAPIAYGEVSDYLTVVAGTATTVTFKNNGNSTATATGIIAPQVGSKYTLFYYASTTGDGLVTGIQNDPVAPAAGKVKVRFLNLGSTFQSSLSIATSAATALVTGLAYNYGSPYHIFDHNLGLTVKVDGTADAVTIPNTTFQTGKNYTIWFDATNPTTPNYHVVLEN